ncbi:MAG: hypothetical protein PHD13_04735 [Methanocellales archaeon]|nr:hypothetical protein [Methanocellales archaeon]MDD3291286.1 hypothetical protein [Methanocellales archaeon]MDD5235458.1 hypothetical protein [Methanocellales archaeon]MDD5484459.1 hypothetical protein [Methanocellales archaeon]
MKLQTIHINRSDINSIEFDIKELTIPLSPGDETSFEIKVINYGTPTHIYLSATENIRDKITFLSHNPYVRYEETIPIVARLPRDGKGLYVGEIVVTTGYGAKKSGFVIKLGLEEETHVVVDEGLVKRKYIKMRHKKAVDITLVWHPLAIPLMICFIIVFLILAYAKSGNAQLFSAVMASVLIVFVILYGLIKLVKA